MPPPATPDYPALETLLLPFSPDAAAALIPPARALFLGARPHPSLSQWRTLITGWQPFKPLADAWDSAGFARVDMVPKETWPLVMILPGKSRDETLALFAIARAHLEPGGTLIAAMPNSAGAGRYEKELATATGSVSSTQKNKCRAFFAIHDGSWNDSLFQTWQDSTGLKSIPGSHYLTCAGVFSADHIDPGSLLLTKLLPANLRGLAADLGAGWGYLSDQVLRRYPGISRIDLFEADSRALDCARRNLETHDPSVHEIHFHWHDVARGIPGSYDVILMNPPFHTGQSTDPDLGRAFITSAATALRRGGSLLLVANRCLPYEAHLQACGLAWRKIQEDSTYKVLSGRKP